MEYTGRIRSPLIDGEVALIVEENGLALTAPMIALSVPYAEVISFEIRNYAMHIQTESGELTVTGLGLGLTPFFDELYAAYNQKVRKALFVSGTPKLQLEGEYRYNEQGTKANGRARIEVYGDCVLILPPNDSARRIPLCFVSAVEKRNFSLTLWLNTGESYTFLKLGYDTEPFSDALERLLKALYQKSLDWVKALDPSLSAIKASAIARMMPEGAAVPLGELASVAPSFAKALESRVMAGKSAQSFAVLKTLCPPEKICVGIKRRFGVGGGGAAIDGQPEEEEEQTQDADGAMIWMIAPGHHKGVAAVEFAVEEESAATFLYRFDGSFEQFVQSFNRALEAIAFRREIIRLSEDELKKPENADIALALKRNRALRFVRNSFAGRVIHSSPERWKQGVMRHFGVEDQAESK